MKRIFSTDIIKRVYTIKSDKILSLPIVIIMPHSRCNCRCVMCDIWKGNNNIQELCERDIMGMLDSFKEFNTQSVVLSGGEALMHPGFFRLCGILRSEKLNVTILSTGLLLKKYADEIISKTNEVIVSLDGSRTVHDKIRNIPNAYDKLKEGVREIKEADNNFRVTARCVIQKQNIDDLPNIIESAHEIGIDQISFLTADVSTDAFNRQEKWGIEKIDDVLLSFEELKRFERVIEGLFRTHKKDFENKFIAENPEKFRRFHKYYAAFHGLCEFPPIRCNAPWVSAVVEADGSVRPCFFHAVSGNIKEASLIKILNSENSVSFRKNLDVKTNSICEKCVCSLNLSPFAKL